MKSPWLAPPLCVPTGFSTGDCIVRPLTIHDAVHDYDAVMTSRATIQGLFGPGSDWPAEGLTLEQNLIDLAWHQKEFELRGSFAYTVVSADATRTLGCIYVYPSRKRAFDAEVFFWVRATGCPAGFEGRLATAVNQWLQAEWPFATIARPGRDIPWEDWDRLP
ncbi:MAG: GNAT family N-acetyltransferase [Betaproteobacteria bacterium]